MRILMVNKFLYPRGGAETYVFELADELTKRGHEIAYYGMFDEKNIIPDTYHAFAKNVDFHQKSITNLTYPATILYSKQAREGIREVIKNFKPDVAHLNNYNFQLTPSILDALHEEHIPIVMTAHDFQMICPNHLLFVPSTNEICEACIDKPSTLCIKQNCIHNSKAKSVLGYLEAKLYQARNNYDYIDRIICPSLFMKTMLDRKKRFQNKTIFLRNFSKTFESKQVELKKYVLYFGRLFEEKGIRNLVYAMKELHNIPFIIAGMGPLSDLLQGIPNVQFVGFQMGEQLQTLIQQARFTVYPSIWYENCPLSIMESQKLGTPCLATGIGGMTELVGNEFVIPDTTRESLTDSIKDLYQNQKKLENMKKEMMQTVATYPTIQEYAECIEAEYGKLQSNNSSICI